MVRSLKHIICAQFLLLALIGCDNRKPVEKVTEKVDFDKKCEQLVLSENKIGQEYLFKVLSKKEVLEYHITYLGEIANKDVGKIKFLNFIVYFGLYEDSKRANGAVVLYSGKDKFLGLYGVGSAYSVPTKIEGSNLVFNYNDENCNQTTVINFSDSIPKQIFINCTKDGGDLYSFTKE
ncbi:MAG: hypothetical protein ABL940_04010 [Bacteroidia bacterium]